MSEASPVSATPRVVSRPPWFRYLRLGLLLLAAGVAGWIAYANLTYPSDRTPEGAYLRVSNAVNRGRPQDFFAYIETPAQHACYTIRDFRKRARERVSAAYPEPERSRLLADYAAEASAPDGADIFALYAQRRGWLGRLRRDLSGVAKVEQKGERATVETVHGTRYPFRIRPENGIYGLTLFTAELVSEAERAARDYGIIEKAAADYERARQSSERRSAPEQR
ncbi:MAG: hypothetical protein M3020_23560 [Myxococcota bacterium]|jgi:hypothetical protein|nr:hypothetical protein [Myxococcota bacterium]